QREQAVYEAAARARGIAPLSAGHAFAAVRERLRARGIVPEPKRAGELHVVYAAVPTNWEPHNIPPALERLGKVSCYYLAERGFDPASPRWLEERERLDADLLAWMRELHAREPVDAFVGYLSGWHVAPETVRAIGGLGIFTASFHLDDRLWFRGPVAGGRAMGPAPLAPAYDLNLTNASASLVKYQVEGGVALFWPPGANLEHFRPLERPFEHDVSFVGARYGERPVFIERLRRAGMTVSAFGPGWPGGPLKEEEMLEVYARSRINLGFGGIAYSMRERCLKGRDFEVPACGTVYLTSEHPDLHRVYDVGREVVTYRDADDCVRQIRGLLADPGRCAAIRVAARARCEREHGWVHRFAELFTGAGVYDG
ncbi:MAG TPA: glycosyltransferase, partial [Longimicrobiaceae bacterium]